MFHDENQQINIQSPTNQDFLQCSLSEPDVFWCSGEIVQQFERGTLIQQDCWDEAKSINLTNRPCQWDTWALWREETFRFMVKSRLLEVGNQQYENPEQMNRTTTTTTKSRLHWANLSRFRDVSGPWSPFNMIPYWTDQHQSSFRGLRSQETHWEVWTLKG